MLSCMHSTCSQQTTVAELIGEDGVRVGKVHYGTLEKVDHLQPAARKSQLMDPGFTWLVYII